MKEKKDQKNGGEDAPTDIPITISGEVQEAVNA